MMLMRLALVALLGFTVAPALQARTWIVGPDGTGDAPTIQAAIDSSLHGDVVLVQSGTYFVNINLRGKAIRLKSQSGPHATILDGSQGDSSVVTCNTDEDNRTVIEGFTICHGKGSIRGLNGRRGGGVFCYEAAPTIRKNIIRDNRAVSGGSDRYEQSRGGGIWLQSHGRMALVEDNIFENNFATTLGGGFIGNEVHLRRNRFLNNSVEVGDGGGVYLWSLPTLLEENLFVANVAGDHGGGLYITNYGSFTPASQMVIRRNIFVGNEAYNRDGYGGDCSGGAIWLGGHATIQENTIAFNKAESERFPAGAGICVFESGPDTVIERNLVVRNQQGGLAATPYFETRGLVRHNLFFGNGPDDIIESPALSGGEVLWTVEDNIFEDPFLCVLGIESRGELAGASPALHQEYGTIGAVAMGTCSPWIMVSVEPTTWGSIKLRYQTSSPTSRTGDEEP